MSTLKVYQDARGEWRWSLIACNGRKLADSGEGYTRRGRCVAIAHRIFPWFALKGTKK